MHLQPVQNALVLIISVDKLAPGQPLVACMACVRVYTVSVSDAAMPAVRSNEATFTQPVLPCTGVGSVSRYRLKPTFSVVCMARIGDEQSRPLNPKPLHLLTTCVALNMCLQLILVKQVRSVKPGLMRFLKTTVPCWSSPHWHVHMLVTQGY